MELCGSTAGSQRIITKMIIVIKQSYYKAIAFLFPPRDRIKMRVLILVYIGYGSLYGSVNNITGDLSADLKVPTENRRFRNPRYSWLHQCRNWNCTASHVLVGRNENSQLKDQTLFSILTITAKITHLFIE